ncbi:MAG TPA: RNA polymerase sigma factor RpoD/SigA [bacterium]|nr:RNA polymerase sigma factor RpoD/SigA [bacterium]HQL62827.1 RNA polymerase sigma factor RpoD/SigA [bacterium]
MKVTDERQHRKKSRHSEGRFDLESDHFELESRVFDITEDELDNGPDGDQHSSLNDPASGSAIQTYLHEMGQHSLLGKFEEIELSKQIERGRKAILRGIAMTREGSKALAHEIGNALSGEISTDKIVFSGPEGGNAVNEEILKRLRLVQGTLDKLGKSSIRSENTRNRKADEVSEFLSDLRFDPCRLEEIGRDILNLRGKTGDPLLPKAKKAIRDGWVELDDARQKMVQGNLRLVISVARRYRNHGLDMLDLIQEGNLGLMKAVDRFDHRKGCKFSTYAVWWIRQTIRRAITSHVRPVRLPANVVDILTKMRVANDKLRQELQREPFDDELAETIEIRPDQIQTLKKVMQSHVSLETPLGDDGESVVGHMIPDENAVMPWENVESTMLYDRLNDLLKTLPEREEVILRLRYGIGGTKTLTLDEIAERFGVTRERVRQLEVRALRKMRHPRRAVAIKSFLN